MPTALDLAGCWLLTAGFCLGSCVLIRSFSFQNGMKNPDTRPDFFLIFFLKIVLNMRLSEQEREKATLKLVSPLSLNFCRTTIENYECRECNQLKIA